MKHWVIFLCIDSNKLHSSMSTLGKQLICERNKIRYDLQYLAKDYENKMSWRSCTALYCSYRDLHHLFGYLLNLTEDESVYSYHYFDEYIDSY